MMKQKIFVCIGMMVMMTEFLSAGEKPNAEIIVRRIADNVLAHTTFQLIDKESGRQYDSSEGLTFSKSIAIESPYNDWKYWNGVLNLGMLELSDMLDEKKYEDFAIGNMHFAFDNVVFFQSNYTDENIWHYPLAQLFVMSELDHCGAEGASCIEVYKRDSRKAFKAYIDKAAFYVLKGQHQLEDGTLVRHSPQRMTLWADDLYMSVPLLARYGDLTQDIQFFDFAALQIEKFREYLYNPKTELYYHCYYSDNGENGVAHWGRCNGWVMMAQVNLLHYLPKNHPKREQLIQILHEQVVGISRYQSESGLWHQVLNRSDSYLETSCTAMFTYAIAKGVHEGWLDSRYLSIAKAGWKGLQTKIREDGQVEGICIGTGIENDMVFYYKRPTQLNDIHGLGAVLLAGIEMMKVEAD